MKSRPGETSETLHNLCLQVGQPSLFQIERIRQAIANGADVNERDKYGFTPLHYAAQNGKHEILIELLNNSEDNAAITLQGVTPIFLAAQYGHEVIVGILIAEGADLVICTNEEYFSYSPLIQAIEHGHANIASKLITANPALIHLKT